MKYTFVITRNDIQVVDSYTIPKRNFGDCLDEAERTIYTQKLDCIVMDNRTRVSLKLELAAHNFLYALGIARERTHDCDLNHPQKWYEKAAYAILGTIGYIFIK